MIQLQPSEFWYHLQIFGSIREDELIAPSWVPDWRQVNIFIQPRLLYPEIDVGTLIDSPNDRCLQLSGWLYGSIIKVWEISPQSQSHPANIVPEIEVRQHPVDGESVLQIRERVRQNLACLLLLAANIINQKDLYADDLEPFWWALLDVETSQLFQSTLMDWLNEPYSVFAYNWPNNLSRIVNSVLVQSRVFRTMRKADDFDLSYGTLGITPADIEVGDVVFRCSASRTLVEWEYERDLKLVLRPTLYDGFENAFKFVGFCFLKEDDTTLSEQDYWTMFSEKNVVLV